MPFELFEFLKRVMIGVFLISLTLLQKTRSTGKAFIPLEILKLIFTFETRDRPRIFAPFARLCLESAIYVAFRRLISFELKKCIYT